MSDDDEWVSVPRETLQRLVSAATAYAAMSELRHLVPGLLQRAQTFKVDGIEQRVSAQFVEQEHEDLKADVVQMRRLLGMGPPPRVGR